MKLNKDKSQFNAREIKFLGHVITSESLKPDTTKIQAVLEMGNPTDKEAVERLRSTVTYPSRVVPKRTDVFRPISVLVQNHIAWL